MLITTSKSARPKDCSRNPRDTALSWTSLVVLRHSCSSRWWNPKLMREWLRPMPVPSTACSRRSPHGTPVSTRSSLFQHLLVHNPHVMATGNSESSGDSAPIRNIMQNLPPLWSTIHDQTGIAPPSWIAQMPGQNDQHNNQLAKPNGTNDMSIHA